MATLQDIALEAGVSVRTVSVIMRGREKEFRISEARAAMIRGIAERLQYRPDAAARAMRSQRTGLIGLLFEPSPKTGEGGPNSGANTLTYAASVALDQAGYSSYFVPIANVMADEEQRARIFRERMVDGLMVINSVPLHLRQQIKEISPHVIWVDHNHFEPAGCIRRDEAHAGETTIRHLHAKGYRNFLFVQPQHRRGHYSEIGRWAGVRRAVDAPRANMEKLDMVWETPIVEPPARLGQLTGDWAVVTYDGRLALEIIGFCGTLGKRLARDYALASIDGGGLHGPYEAIARMDYDRQRMGRLASEMLLAMLRGGERQSPPSVELKDTWIDGETAPAIGDDRAR